MKEMTERLRFDPELAAAYRVAHEDYLRRATKLSSWSDFPARAGCPTV